MKNRLPNDLRKQIVIIYNEGRTIDEISSFLSLPRTTVKDVIKIFKAEGRIECKSHGGSGNKKNTDKIQRYIDQRLGSDSTIRLHQLKDEIFANFNVNVCLAIIYKHLKMFNYSLRLLKFVPDSSTTSANIEKRKEYVYRFHDVLTCVADMNIFFVDELGFSVTMRPKFGRPKIETTPICRVPKLRSRNISVYCGMNKVGDKFFIQRSIPFTMKLSTILYCVS